MLLKPCCKDLVVKIGFTNKQSNISNIFILWNNGNSYLGGQCVAYGNGTWVSVGQGTDTYGKQNGNNIWYATEVVYKKDDSTTDTTKCGFLQCSQTISINSSSSSKITCTISNYQKDVFYSLIINGVQVYLDHQPTTAGGITSFTLV